MLTHRAHPPNTLVTHTVSSSKLWSGQRQKWFIYILTGCGMMMLHIGLACQMEQGTKAMLLNRWILHDTTTSMYATMKFQCPRHYLVLHHLQESLRFGKTCCQFARASLFLTCAIQEIRGSQTSCVLQVCDPWTLERNRFG